MGDAACWLDEVCDRCGRIHDRPAGAGLVGGTLEAVAEHARPLAGDGDVADYIPALGGADPHAFGLAVSAVDGTEDATGDVDEPFPIQSISKVFALTLAMRQLGGDGEGDREDAAVTEALWSRVGREPSGDPFNSLVQLEHERGIPRNPFINAGSLIVVDVLLDTCRDVDASLTELVSELVGEPIAPDEDVLKSEARTGHRNRAMANLMAAFDNLRNPVEEVLRAYVHQCALAMTARQLARSVRFLANDGVDPASGRRVMTRKMADRVTALMLTCGTYDSAGEFAFGVGFPCKSGVAGGIVGVVPDRMGVCVWSPPLDETGNSLAGRYALEELTDRLDLSIF